MLNPRLLEKPRGPTDNSGRTVTSLDQLHVMRVTSLAHFLECPRSWKEQVLGEVIKRPSKAAIIGTAVHYMIECFLRRDFDLHNPSAQPYWEALQLSGISLKEQKNLAGYLKLIEPYRELVVVLEHEFTLPLHDDAWMMRGHIDALIASEDGGILILDHKTNRNYESSEVWARKIQPIAYAYAARKTFPNIDPDNFWFEIGYVNQGATVRWRTDPVLDQYLERLYREAWEEFEVYERRNEWPERLSDGCKWCPLTSRCYAYQRFNEALVPVGF
jgi:hypothetical protein